MSELKYYIQLSSVALSSWIKINLLAAVSTLAGVIFSLIFIINHLDFDRSEGFFSALGMIPIIPVVLLILIMLSPVLVFILGNNYILQKIIHRVLVDKSQSMISPFLDKIFAKFKEHQPEQLKQGADYSLVKLQLINKIRNESENKWLKRAVVYGLKRIDLHDVDFNNPNTNFYEIVKMKTLTFLQTVMEPDRKKIWLVLASQWVVVIAIFFTAR
ncbi:MAG: hypothetical protein ACJ75J_13195 [Cytophagaceae bacterium]